MPRINFQLVLIRNFRSMNDTSDTHTGMNDRVPRFLELEPCSARVEDVTPRHVSSAASL